MVAERPDWVCSADGIALGRSRVGGWLHLDALPKGADPDHAPDPVPASDYERARQARGSLKDTALDMLEHHAAIHPTSDCPFAARMREALREIPG